MMVRLLSFYWSVGKTSGLAVLVSILALLGENAQSSACTKCVTLKALVRN